MKRNRLWVVLSMVSSMMFLTLVLSGCFTTNPSANHGNYILYGNFGITTDKYKEDTNWDQIIQNVFGSSYRVADWNDFVQYYNKYGESGLIQLLDGLQLSDYQDAAWLKYNGQSNDTDDRYYYLERHNHNLPSYFAAFATIDNHLVDLGSWWGERKILAIKK